jgi:ABC-2 type transport system ATP-binding protein
MALVEVSQLSKSYSDHKVVDEISFSVEKGEIFGILGPNGAGKTTTLEMLETLRPIDSGTALISGIDVSLHPEKIKHIIGVQLQSTAFFDKLKLRELIAMYASIYHRRVDATKLLDEVQLREKADSYVNTLSGGQKQRFSVATALINSPKVLFLDEPTTGLDPQARRNLWELIAAIREKGITIIMTSHYMEEAEMLCDRVAIMDGGKIIAQDTPKSLIKALLAKGFTKKQEVHAANLEDVFIDLTGKALRE